MRIYADGMGHLRDLAKVEPTFDGQIAIEVRGFTSQEFPKKQYALELRDEHGEDRSVALLDMPADPDWALSAPFMDKSLLRNAWLRETSSPLRRARARRCGRCSTWCG